MRILTPGRKAPDYGQVPGRLNIPTIGYYLHLVEYNTHMVCMNMMRFWFWQVTTGWVRSLGRQVQEPLASSSELPHSMCQPKLGPRGIGQRLDRGVGLAVRLQQIQQNLASQGEVEHFAWREVACNEPSCGKSLQHNSGSEAENKMDIH